jgi:hypothetical protein
MPNPQNLIPFTGADDPRRGKKPKGVPNSKTRYQKLLFLIQKAKDLETGELKDFTVMEIIDMKVMEKAIEGDLNAYKEILDRLEGRVAPAEPIPEKLEVKFEVINRVPSPKK